MSASASVHHFLEVDDLSVDDLNTVLALAQRRDWPQVLLGRGVALLFEKPSLRTRNSSEMAVFELGGHPVTLKADEIDLDRREPAADVARVLSGYYAAMCARVFDHGTLRNMAEVADVPVINLLSDTAHPCQALADLLTLLERWGTLEGRSIAYVGDGNNVCNSLLVAGAMVGMEVRVASPAGFAPDPVLVARTNGVVVDDPAVAVEGADAVYTDVWASMGKEDEAEARRQAFAGFTVDEALMARAAPDAVFLHCLPAHRGEEVSAGVVDGPQSVVWRQAHNRMHAFRGLLLWLFS
ncbi:MAG: ornithine carbamoyltransferase [Acidimicrobiaceae bacterium]|jgi:ornithine carbamoyltransferase|nr:ornithine carbamoyltransferase [Acidimicrobiaceae bacterium]MDQ1445931.1 ornithine carbamoyltransferase [Acidimicrobiaceae bacterium]